MAAHNMKTVIDKYDIFFFDFDGVIVDSVNIKSRAFGELFKDYGEDIIKEIMRYHLNEGWALSRYDKFKYYYKNILHKKMTRDVINELDKRFSQLVTKKVVKAPFIDGVIDFLKKLKKKHKKCFIISATPQKEIRRITKLRQIEKFFEEIVGSPMGKRGNFKYLMKKYVIDAAKTVYFGDTEADYEVAAENGIDFVGVEYAGNKAFNKMHNISKIKDFCIGKLKRKETAKCKRH